MLSLMKLFEVSDLETELEVRKNFTNRHAKILWIIHYPGKILFTLHEFS